MGSRSFYGFSRNVFTLSGPALCKGATSMFSSFVIRWLNAVIWLSLFHAIRLKHFSFKYKADFEENSKCSTFQSLIFLLSCAILVRRTKVYPSLPSQVICFNNSHNLNARNIDASRLPFVEQTPHNFLQLIWIRSISIP